MAARRITADVKANVRQLVDVLAPFLPLSTRSRKTTTFETIFRESGVHAYLKGPDSKKQALQKGWEAVFRRHPKLPYTLIRKIVPAAIDYRRYKRDPLKRAELEALIRVLAALEIDMAAELGRIRIDARAQEATLRSTMLSSRVS